MNASFEIGSAESMVYSLLDQVSNMSALIEDLTEKLQALALELELQSMPEMDDDEIERLLAMGDQAILQQEAEDGSLPDGTVISEDLMARANEATRKAMRHRVPAPVGTDSVIS